MRKMAMIIATISLMGMVGANAADKGKQSGSKAEHAAKVDIDQRIRDINRLDNKESARLAGLRAVSQETGVRVPVLEAQQKAHPKVGIAGLLVVNEIAVHNKKEASDILKSHSEGHTWVEIARSHGESLETLDAKLNRVEAAIKGGP